MNQITLGLGLIITGIVMSIAVMANSPKTDEMTLERYKSLESVRCYTLQEMTDEQLELTAYKHDRMLIAVDNLGDGRILDLRERLDAESKKQAVDFACNLHRIEMQKEQEMQSSPVVL